MTDHPIFSIIMPTFNRERTIYKSIDSILSQTFYDFELIIVNDGSTDKTEEILKHITDERVQVVTQENTRQTQARRNACKIASGDFFAFCDSDDVWDPEYLNNIFYAFEENNADYVFTNYIVQNEHVARIDLQDSQTKEWLNRNSITRDKRTYLFHDLFTALLTYQPIFTSCQAVRRNHFLKVGGISEKINNKKLGTLLTSEDSHIIRRCALTDKSVFINKVLVFLGRQSDNVSRDYISNLEGGRQIIYDIINNSSLTKPQKASANKAAKAHTRELCMQYYYYKGRKEFINFYLRNFNLNYNLKSHAHFFRSLLLKR